MSAKSIFRTLAPLHFILSAALLFPQRINSENGVSTRDTLPLTVSCAVNVFYPGVGGDLSYQVAPRFAIGVQYITFFFLHNDFSLRTRFFLVARPRTGWYAGGSLHYWISPFLSDKPAQEVAGELGYEYRSEKGFTLGFGLGGGGLRGPVGNVGEERMEWNFMPVINLRIGKSSS